MSDHGEKLGVDVHEIIMVAKNMDLVADDYAQALELIQSAEPPSVEPPWTNIVMEWHYFRMNISDLLGGTKRNLVDTAAALRKAAKYYTDTDRVAADKLNQELRKDQQQKRNGEG
jgi:hypothetical protein